MTEQPVTRLRPKSWLTAVEAAGHPATLADSCVLLDTLTGDPRWSAWSEQQLAAARTQAPIAINPIIYAEVGAGYDTVEMLDAALPERDFRRLPLPYEAGYLAAQAYAAYRRRGGGRRSPMPDFYIGAHAAVAGLTLLTRDAARYRTYFPTVSLVCPPG